MCYVYLIKSLLKYRKIEMCFEQCKKIMQVFSSIYPVFPFFYYYFFFVHFEIASARMYFVLFFFLFFEFFLPFFDLSCRVSCLAVGRDCPCLSIWFSIFKVSRL